MGFSISWNAWTNGASVDMGDGITVTPAENSHLRVCYSSKPGSDPARACESFSLEVAQGEFRVVFSSDLAASGELSPLLAKPLDVLVSELAHFGAEDLAKTLQGVQIKSLCLIHLSDELAQDPADLQSKMEQLLPQVGDVFIPDDGEVLDF
jgi:ribonuclease BN (tRNA processing enzyme)